MSELNNEYGVYKNEADGNAVPHGNNRETLKEARALLSKTDKSTQQRMTEIERLASQRASDVEKRISEAKARMSENAERARKSAAEKNAILKYSGEYRQRIAAVENKKVELLRKKAEEAELEEERKTAEKRREEIEEFLAREQSELELRNERSERILSTLMARIEKNDGPEKVCESEPCEEKSISPYASDEASIHLTSENAENADEEKSQDVLDGEAESDEKIIITVGSFDTEKSDTAPNTNDENVIHIRPQRVGGGYYNYASSAHGDYPRNSLNTYSVVYPDYSETHFTKSVKNPETEEYDRMADASAFDMRMREADALAEYAKYQSKRFPDDIKGAPSVNTEASDTDYTDIDIREEYPYSELQSQAFEYSVDFGREHLENKESVGIDSTFAAEYDKAEQIRKTSGFGTMPENEEILEANQYFDRIKEHTESLHAESVDLFARSQLSKNLEKFYKEEALLLRRSDKLASRQRAANPEENVTLIVEKIAVRKELCELAIEALGACVHVKAKSRISKHKKLLIGHITAYNSLCDEYEAQTGRAVERIDYSAVDDVLEGRICRPIPTVYYYGNDDGFGHNGVSAESDRVRRYEEEAELVLKEYDRYVSEGPYTELNRADRRASQKRQSERMSVIRRAAERDMLLISLRNEYRIASLEARRDILANSFGADRRSISKEIKSVNRKISKVKHAERRSAELERADNSRYYLLPALPLTEEKTKKGARRERLESLRLRLDVLLAERESINERLIALYGGSDKKLRQAKIKRKAGGVRRKSAKAMRKKQSDIARKIERYRAPADMKERAYELLNKKIACAAAEDENRYKLRRMKIKGRARRELIYAVKRAKRDMKRADRELKYMLRKLKRQEERYRDEREWLIMLFIILLLVGAGIGSWIIFGERIIAYFRYLIDWFKR